MKKSCLKKGLLVSPDNPPTQVFVLLKQILSRTVLCPGLSVQPDLQNSLSLSQFRVDRKKRANLNARFGSQCLQASVGLVQLKLYNGPLSVFNLEDFLLYTWCSMARGRSSGCRKCIFSFRGNSPASRLIEAMFEKKKKSHPIHAA